jgi:hypothetical protein
MTTGHEAGERLLPHVSAQQPKVLRPCSPDRSHAGTHLSSLSSPRPTLPALAERRVKPRGGAVGDGDAENAARPARLVVGEIGETYSFAPRKSLRKAPACAQRPTSSEACCQIAQGSPGKFGSVTHHAPSYHCGLRSASWVEGGLIVNFKGVQNHSAGLLMPTRQKLWKLPDGADAAEASEGPYRSQHCHGIKEPSASMPSTPRRGSTREPSMRVRRAVLRETNLHMTICKSPASRRSDVPHAPTPLPVPKGCPPSRGGDESSRGSSRGSPASRLASCQTMMGARPPISSLPPAESRHSTPCTWAGTTTPYACSPRTRIDVSDVSDALKEHCTSALSSTLRGVTSLNEQHKTQIMDSYCHEVCVVLQDFEGLQRENIFVCHRQESDALRSALRLEYDRQQQILHEKLAARHHARELAAKAANGVQETVESVLALDATETFVKNKHACACTGTRDESGACRDCWALRFQVKSRNIAAVLNAASTLLVRQAEVLPGLRDRLGPEPLVTMNKAQDPAEAGASVAAEAIDRGSEEQRAERCVTRPVTAAGGRGLGATLPEGWVVRTSRSTGKDFYYHSASKKTQWLRPD